MRIALYLMGQKGEEILKTALHLGKAENICAVVGSRDEGMIHDYFNEIRDICGSKKIDFHEDKLPIEEKADAAFVIGWKRIIKNSNDCKIIVFHDSILPRYRGFNPLVSHLVNGEPKIGATAFYASDSFDEGDIILQSVREIEYPIKIAHATDIMISLYKDLFEKIYKEVSTGNFPAARQQAETEASYSLWRDEEDYRIDWSSDAKQVSRFVDAVGYPYKGASTILKGRPVRILGGIALDDLQIENRVSGKIIFLKDGDPVVVCGKGLYRVSEAKDDMTNQSILPMNQLRLRFC